MKQNGNAPGTVPDKLQPHNVEAEEAVIGSLLIDPDVIIKLAPVLAAKDFYIERNGMIYQAVRDLWQAGKPSDLVTLCDHLTHKGQLDEIGGPAHITGLINVTPSSIHAGYYADIVARTAGLRHLIQGAGEIARLAYADPEDLDSVMDRAEEILFGITARKDRQRGPRHIRLGLDAHADRMEYLQQHQDRITGLPTGVHGLDLLLGGLQKSDMIVLAGRPSMGKTSLALSIALNAAKKWAKRIAIFSLEMSESQLIDRLISADTGIDSQRLRNGQIHEDEWAVYLQARGTMAERPIFIDDTPGLTPFDLRARARRLYAEYGLDLLILDYLQLMDGGDRRSGNRQEEISFISRSIKALARELNIPILAISQLSRALESRQDKHPMLSDLRESGAIEQDSDVVMFVYRDEVYDPKTEFPNVAEIIVGKHRNGPTGVFSVYFKKHLAQFVDLEIRRHSLEGM